MKNLEGKKAIIYTRVSTTEQKERGQSLKQQKRLLEDFCNRTSLEVVAHFEEDYSAKNFDRPEFKKLTKFTKQNQVDYVLCYDWSRFSRNIDKAFSIISLFKERNIEINTSNQWVDYTEPNHITMLAIYLSQPNVENLVRGDNTKKGIAGALREGRYVNRAPIGYFNDKGLNETGKPTIQLCSEKGPLIKEIFEKYSTGQYSQEDLRKEYFKKGINIQADQFGRMLSNPIYIAKLHAPAFEDLKEEIVDAIHEPIIDELTFIKVQKIKSNKTSARSNTKKKSKHDTFLPLRGGILECAKCGSNLTGSRSKGKTNKYYYYHCTKTCKERFRADLAHKEVEDILGAFKVDKGLVKLFKAILKERYKASYSKRLANKSTLTKKLDSIMTKKDNLTEKFCNNDVEKVTYDRLMLKYNVEVNEIKLELAKFEDKDKDLDKFIEFGVKLMENLGEFYSKAEVVVKKKIISSIFPEKLVFVDKKYRTPKINEGIELIFNYNRELQSLGHKKRDSISRVSTSVARKRFELLTSGV